MVARFGFSGAFERERQQRLALEPMQLGLEPALLEAIHPRQCLVEQLQRFAEVLLSDVEPGQQAENAGRELKNADGFHRRQASAQLGDPCLNRAAVGYHPAMKDRPTGRPAWKMVLRGQRN